MHTDMGKCTSQWTNNSEHCHYVNLMFEGFFAEVDISTLMYHVIHDDHLEIKLIVL